MKRISLASMGIALMSSLGLAGMSPAIIDRPNLAIAPQMPVISKPSKRLRKTTTFKRNGKREVARRLRQIAAGQLTRSNGLVTADELYGRKAA